MFKVLMMNAISTKGLQNFSPDKYEISNHVFSADAILLRSHKMQMSDLSSSVKVVGRAGAGVNNIPVEQLSQMGIPVLNTPGANANAVKEAVIAGMLIASRNLCSAWDYARSLEGTDRVRNEQMEREKKRFAGFELQGKTLGLIGLGNIGVKVANAAIHLGMKVIGFDPTITVNRAWELHSNVQQAHNLVEVLQQSDFVTIHVPLTDETRGMVTDEYLRKMKKTGVLLNFSRDGIVDNLALNACLLQEKLFAYVSDFPCNDLTSSRAICFPHIGASTVEAEENCAVMVVDQVMKYLETGSIINSVNFPNVEIGPCLSGTRLAIVNANIPNMVAQITAKLAASGINIKSFINQSRSDIAYTLIDVEEMVPATLLTNIANIKHVIQVRKINSTMRVSKAEIA